MSTHVSHTGEGIPLESRQSSKVPEIHNNNLPPGAIVRDVRADGEHIPGMVKESTVWDVYNNEAKKVDNELVKDWTTSLNFLLVFAAIFAAVLTAFIIESKKMLEQDPTEILVDIAIQYLNNIGNQSRSNLTRPDFEPSFEAISINCLLFASLGASLIAALASVVALQWVSDYDAVITRGGSSPLDRAKRRQFRYAGVTRWKMGELIAALPLLLYSSVILFWAGAIQWMWSLNHTVGYVVAGGTAIAMLFYGSTTLLGAIFVSSPFKTPLSRGLYWLPLRFLSLVGRFLLWVPIEGTFQFLSKLYQSISSHMRPFTASEATSDDQNASVSSLYSYIEPLPLSEMVPKWITRHLITIVTSRRREDETAKQDPVVQQEALAWLAQQLPISDDAHERLLLCASGILALSTENPSSPRFHDAPWLAILELLSEHFMRQILDPVSLENDYQGVGIVLQCINNPSIRPKVVPTAMSIQDPGDPEYWFQFRRTNDNILYSNVMETPSMTFLLARDVPVPSLGSKHELEATWKLIRWRNSFNMRTRGRTIGCPQFDPTHDDIWPDVFSDIGQYSPEFLESCLCQFQKWTNILPHRPSGLSDYAIMFDSIVKHALHRGLTTRETPTTRGTLTIRGTLALACAFAGSLTRSVTYRLSEPEDETTLVPQPLSYALAVGVSSEASRTTHLAITLILIQAANLSASTEQRKWARWITLMLWVSIPKVPGFLNDSQEDSIGNSEETRNIWDEIEMSSTGVIVQGTHVEEIGRELWGGKNTAIESLPRDAFKNPQCLRYLDLLLHWIPHCHRHHTGSQHILIHLYEDIWLDRQESPYCIFRTTPARLEGIDWTRQRCHPILAMLALSDSQDLTCLRFGGGVDLESARRILEIVKAVKTQPVEFLCLLVDIISTEWSNSPTNLPLLLESIKQAMAFLNEESITSFLRVMVLELEDMLWVHRKDSGIVGEIERIYHLLQVKYAASFISSSSQLQLLSCTRSAAVAQPAIGWLSMHGPL